MERSCTVPGCKTKARSGTSPYCEKHYYRLRRNGTLALPEKPKLTEQSKGYLLRYAPNHPLRTRCSPRVYEHRYVYFENHGPGPFLCHWCNKRITWDDMDIDHLNSNIKDNRPENLVASCPACNKARGHEKMRKAIRQRLGVHLTHNGQTMTKSEWARKLGISRNALDWRLQSGWSLSEALTKPRGESGPKPERNNGHEAERYGIGASEAQIKTVGVLQSIDSVSAGAP